MYYTSPMSSIIWVWVLFWFSLSNKDVQSQQMQKLISSSNIT